nr:hypothetical protein GCM10020092_077270 [Actinoplanes digitatis]
MPMSFAQRRFHFLQSVAPDSAAYHVVEAVRLTGALDERRVRAALATVVARHEVLRSTCAGDDELLVADEGGPRVRRRHGLRTDRGPAVPARG